MDQWIIWLIIIIVLSFVEATTVNLVSIWFIVSAFIAMILSFFTIPMIWQFGVFVLFGVFLMITTKPILKNWLKLKEVKTNTDRVLGMIGIVTEEITINHIGEVKVDGKKWSAISTKKIPVGEEVIIDSIDGVKLKVHKREN